MFFVPLTQRTNYVGALSNKIEESSMYFGSIELHVEGEPGTMAPAVRAALASVDPNLPPTAMTMFAELVGITTSERTLVAKLSDAFGAITLLLSAVGLYGVTGTGSRDARASSVCESRLGRRAATSRASSCEASCRKLGMGLLIGLPLALAAAWALHTSCSVSRRSMFRPSSLESSS